MTAHIFLRTIVKFYNLSMFHLEDIGENVNNHGHHNEAYITWIYATALDNFDLFMQTVSPISGVTTGCILPIGY